MTLADRGFDPFECPPREHPKTLEELVWEDAKVIERLTKRFGIRVPWKQGELFAGDSE